MNDKFNPIRPYTLGTLKVTFFLVGQRCLYDIVEFYLLMGVGAIFFGPL